MRVLLLTDRMDTGGAETHLFQLACGLRSMGVDVTLLSEGGRLCDQLEQLGIPQIRLRLRTRNPLRLLWLRHRLKKILKDGNFSIAHAHARIPAFLLRGIKSDTLATVVTAHAKFRVDPLRKRLSYWGEETVAVSEDLRSYLCDSYRLPPERITVISNGIDCARFSPPESDSRHSQNGSITVYRILFASRMDKDCSLGAELLCRITPSLISEFPNVKITLAGGGNDLERIRALADHINRMIGTDTLEVCGHVESIADLMRQSTVFVGVSRAALEAAACGCAVILCGNEGYLGILNASRFSLALRSNFCARGEDQPIARILLSDIKELLRHPEKRAQNAKELRALLLTKCSAEQMCLSTLRLYQKILPTPSRATITVGGYFGCGNFGDDAILLGFLNELRVLAPDITVQALTGDPRYDRARFGIRCYHRANPISVLRALKKSDLFLCGGGSLLQNITSHRSLFYYLYLLRIAQKHCPTVLYACGVGPLIGKYATKKTQDVLNTCAYISLRDAGSWRLLSSIGVNPALLHIGADTALFLPPPPSGREFAVLYPHLQEQGQHFFAVILRDMKEDRFLFRVLCASIRTACLRYGWTPLFICTDQQRDQRITRLAAHRLGGIAVHAREVSDITALLRVSEVVLTLRLHGMILASTAGTPALGVCPNAHEQKLIEFGKRAGLPVLSLEKLTVAAIVEALEELYRCAPQIRSVMKESLAEQRKKARKDLENIIQMIYNKDSTQKKITENGS